MFPTAYTAPETAAEITAKSLIEIGAVHFRADPPFTLTSGLVSPVYIDCRKLISYPRIRAALMDFCVQQVTREAGLERFDAVAGGETAGIPFAAWIAERMGLPMLYVRKKPKGFGRNARIEGDLKEGARVLLVEDLTTEGGSKVNFANAIREAGGECSHTLVVFFYDAFKGTRERLAGHGLTLHALATWEDVLPHARASGLFEGAVLDEVEKFLADPLAWSGAHGGLAELPG